MSSKLAYSIRKLRFVSVKKSWRFEERLDVSQNYPAFNTVLKLYCAYNAFIAIFKLRHYSIITSFVTYIAFPPSAPHTPICSL